jgi:hypothetical protein
MRQGKRVVEPIVIQPDTESSTTITDGQEIANMFGEFFTNKVLKTSSYLSEGRTGGAMRTGKVLPLTFNAVLFNDSFSPK